MHYGSELTIEVIAARTGRRKGVVQAMLAKARFQLLLGLSETCLESRVSTDFEEVVARVPSDELREIFATARPRVHCALILKYFKKKAYKEISLLMGVAVPTVCGYLTEGRRLFYAL